MTTLMQTVEINKENFVPLKEGRNAADVVATLQTQLAVTKKTDIEQQSKVWREKAEAADESSDDPLEVWLQYLHWIELTFSTTSEYKVALLREVTDKYKEDARYTNYPKYIDTWIKYADTQTDPGDIYTYMHSKGIGKANANFYKSYAIFLESRLLWSQAEKVYQEGIKNNARPTEVLKNAQQGFSHRFVQHTRQAMAEGADDAAIQVVARPALHIAATASSAPPASVSSLAAARPVHGAPVPASKLIQHSNQGRARVEVFVMEDDADSSTDAPSATWNQDVAPLPASVTQRENIALPTTWHTGLGAPAGASVTKKQRLEVFEDGDGVQKVSVPTVPPVLAAAPKPKPASAAAKAGTTRSTEDEFVDPLQSFEEMRASVYVKRIAARKAAEAAAPSPTVHTKFALDEIDSLFNKPLETFAWSGQNDSPRQVLQVIGGTHPLDPIGMDPTDDELDVKHYVLEDLLSIYELNPQRSAMHHNLVAFYTIELLREIGTLHKNGTVHGNICPGSIALRFDETDLANWVSTYHADGSQGWSSRGIQLRHVPPGSLLTHQPSLLVDEICGQRPRKFQVDYFGVCGAIYAMLYGAEMQVHCVPSSVPGQPARWQPILPATRPANGTPLPMWASLMDELLNHTSLDRLASLDGHQAQLEKFLSDNPQVAVGFTRKTLKDLLKQVETLLFEHKSY